MKKDLVSIIIPVYNCIPYIKKCIISILKQSYKELEILILDDASTDGSAELCDDFQKKDSRIQVFHLEKHNVSAVRNYGLSKATGEYVLFVDGDDEVKPQMVEILVKEMNESQVDMVVCNYLKKLKPMLIVSNSFQDRPGIYEKNEYLKRTIQDAGHHYYGVVWNKLYRHSIIKDHNICFCEDVCLGEDFIFNMDYWKQIDSISVISNKLYVYSRLEKRSLSKQTNPRLSDCEKELANRRKIYAHYVELMKYTGLYETYKKDIEYYWIVFYVRQLGQMRMYQKGWNYEQKLYWKKQMQEDDMIHAVTKKYSEKELEDKIRHFVKQSRVKVYIKRMMKIH